MDGVDECRVNDIRVDGVYEYVSYGVWGSSNVKYLKSLENHCGKFFINSFSGRLKIFLSKKCENSLLI